MNIKKQSFFRWGWMVLAAALICTPASAQDWCGDGYVTCYSAIDIDAYSNISGASGTEVPYYYYDFGYGAFAEGLLNDPSGAAIMDVYGWDDGTGYAEADTYGFASANGVYGQYGSHELEDYGDYLWYLGDTMDSWDWEGVCTFPDSEATSIASPPWKDMGEGSTEGSYVMAPAGVSGGSSAFANRWSRERDGGDGGDSCNSIYSGGYAPTNNIPYLEFRLHDDGTYGDWVGYFASYVHDLQTTYSAYLPCSFYVLQIMDMQCDDGSWHEWTMDYHTAYVYSSSIEVCRADICEP